METSNQSRTEGKALRGTDKERFWQQHIEAHEARGQTIRQYCEVHGLKECTFQYWRQKFLERHRSKAGFAKVVARSSESRVVAKIRLASGIEVECLQWPEVEWLQRLSFLG